MTVIGPKIQKLLDSYENMYNQMAFRSNAPQVFSGVQLIADYVQIADATQADAFFGIYGVGNASLVTHIPFERMGAYELLLEILISYDPRKYHEIHKGSPYYFIGWTAFQYRDFAKSMFYMDAAVSEDLKNAGVQDKSAIRPSLDFFLLNEQSHGSALKVHKDIKEAVEGALEDYRVSSAGILTADAFRSRFAADLLYSGPRERSLLTALYTFMLEYQEKKQQILLRSNTGGSIQPFLDHLFDGARILESLLEKKGGGSGMLYNRITGTRALDVTQSALLGRQTLAQAVEQHNFLTTSGSSFQDVNFAATYIIRNTTGHSLLWPDQFPDQDSYKLLFKSVLNSIFWTIEKLWTEEV